MSESSSSAPSTKTKPLRVGIIGAGVGGLVLAQLLLKDKRFSVSVYERGATEVDTDSLAGFRILVAPELLDELKKNLPQDLLPLLNDSIGSQRPGGQQMCLMDPDGSILLRYNPAAFEVSRSVSRWKLRKALLHNADKFLTFGKEFKEYEETKDGVKAIFADGQVEEFDLLVGADGSGSRIRRQLLPDSKRSDTGLTVIYFKMPLTPETEAMIPFGSGCMVMGPRRSMIVSYYKNETAPYGEYNFEKISRDESFLMCGLGCYTDEFVTKDINPDDMTPEQLKAECVSRVQTWHPLFRSLVAHTIPESVYLAHIKTQDEISPWKSGRVTILGDAAHSMTPYLGLGATSAIADSLRLASDLKGQAGTIPELLQRYEKSMLARGFDAARRSMSIHKLVFAYGATPLHRKVRNFVLRIMDMFIGKPALPPPQALGKRPSKVDEDAVVIEG